MNKWKKILMIFVLAMSLIPYSPILADENLTKIEETPISEYEINLYWQDQTNNPNKSLSYYGKTSESEDVNVTTTLSIEVGKNYLQEAMEIRLPFTLWKYRDNSGYASFLDAGITGVPGSNPNVPFYYTVDANTNELVIHNYAYIKQGQKFTIDFRYRINQPKTVDLSTVILQAKGSAIAENEANVVIRNSQKLNLTFNSYFEITQLQKTAQALYFWDTSYNPNQLPKDKNNIPIENAPEDFANYNWVLYSIPYSGTLGQPVTANMSDFLEASDNGEIYAYQTGTGYDYWASDDATWNNDGTFTIQRQGNPVLQPTVVSGVLHLFVRYPKMDNASYTNNATLTFTGVDNPTNPKKDTRSTQVTYDWKEYTFPYDNTAAVTIDKKDNAPNSHTLDLYQLTRNNDILFDWMTTQTSEAYGYSDVQFDQMGNATINNGKLDPEAIAPGMKVEVYDDFTEWAKDNDPFITMNASDYEYDSVSLQLKLIGIDRNDGRQLPINAESLSQPVAQIYALVEGQSSYQLIDTLDSSDWDSSSASFKKDITTLPANTIKLKVAYTAIDQTTLNMNPTMKIKANSPQLEQWNINELTSLTVRNYAQVANFDQEGTWLNAQDEPVFNQPIYDNGKYLQADVAQITIVPFDPIATSGALKIVSDGINQPNNQWISYDVSLVAADGYSAITLEDFDTLKNNGTGLPETRKAKFYDLLPFGMYYQNNSVSAEPAWSYITSPTFIPGVEVETINNYKGTGRQMVIFTVDYSKLNNPRENGGIFDSWSAVSPMNPYAFYGKQGYYTGFKVNFKMILPWGNTYISEKSDKTNYFAYQKTETVLSNDLGTLISNVLLDKGTNPYPFLDMPGSLDNGSYFPNLITENGQYVFANLRNGVSMLDEPDTLYNKDTYTIDQIQATQVGLQKFVKSNVVPDYTAYSKFTMVPYGADYSYKLQLVTSDTSVTSNMIIFDVLETAKMDNESGWKGTFKDIDVSQLEMLGIDPVIYYSTSSNPELFTQQDIENGTIPDEWSTVIPSDLKDVKAIAVDATKDYEGNDYLFEPKTDVSSFIIMTAPNSAQVEKAAFNQGSYVSKLINTGEENFLDTDITKVELYDRGELVKTSDIGNGTNEDNAAEVKVGDIITYRMYYDSDMSGTQQVFDTLPANLQLVKDSMYYNIGGEGEINVPTTNESYDPQKRQLIYPELSTDDPVRYEFKALVVAPNDDSGKIILKNVADVLWNRETWKQSNPVTHKLLNRWADIEKNAYPVLSDNTMKDTPDNGTSENPYPVSPEQIVEYRLNVTAEGYPDLESGALIISDLVPENTTLIADSLKGEITRSEGSTASGENSGTIVDIDGKQAVQWTLEKMLTGDLATLTFRVIAPTTNESRFDNTATLVDVQKKDTVIEYGVTTIDENGNVKTYEPNEPLYSPQQYTKISNTTYHIVEINSDIPFHFIKVDADDHSILLSNAVFDVYYCNEEHNHDQDSECFKQNEMMRITSDSNGKVDLGNLQTGTYLLVEKTAPSGYIKSDGYWFIDVNTNDDLLTIQAMDKAVPFIENNNEFMLPNNKKQTPPIKPHDKDEKSPSTGYKNLVPLLITTLATCSFVILIKLNKKKKSK